jgi:hypothetical protein
MCRRSPSRAPFRRSRRGRNLRLSPSPKTGKDIMSAIATSPGKRFLARLFTPDHQHYEGVRPIQVYVLRTLYVLMFLGVGIPVWMDILRHQGPWDHVRAVAFCAWAAYPTLGLLGLRRPLQMLPLVLFMLFYKTVWLAVVAYPLWASGQLAGSPAEEMARVFRGVFFIYPLLPWGYIWRSYVAGPKRAGG